MTPLPEADADMIERALAERLSAFASELRLIDAADFVAFIRTGQTANLENLVQSSTELYFKPGTLRLAAPGEVELFWDTAPLVTLPFEFHHGPLRVYFRLRLAARSAAVHVESLVAAGNAATANDLTACLIRALEEARPKTRPTRGCERPEAEPS